MEPELNQGNAPLHPDLEDLASLAAPSPLPLCRGLAPSNPRFSPCPGSSFYSAVLCPARVGSPAENRTPLTVGFSHDEGESWFGFQSLEDEARKAWSYPTIRFLDDFAHVLYYERTETERGETRISLKMQKLAVGPD